MSEFLHAVAQTTVDSIKARLPQGASLQEHIHTFIASLCEKAGVEVPTKTVEVQVPAPAPKPLEITIAPEGKHAIDTSKKADEPKTAPKTPRKKSK